MMTNEMREKIDKECITWVETQKAIEKKGIKKDKKSEHKYRFQNFIWVNQTSLMDGFSYNPYSEKGERYSDI